MKPLTCRFHTNYLSACVASRPTLQRCGLSTGRTSPLLSSAAASASPSASSAGDESQGSSSTSRDGGGDRLKSIAARRRNVSSTKSLWEKDSGREMHSNLLSEHPLKVKYDAQRLSALHARVAEEAYRDRQNTTKQREAAKLSEELEDVHRTVAFHRTKEYKWYIVSALSGHLLSSYLVYNYYYSEDARLEYDPVAGYVEDIRQRKEEMVAEDAFLKRNGVTDHFVKKKAV